MKAEVRALALNGVFDILREHGKQVFDEDSTYEGRRLFSDAMQAEPAHSAPEPGHLADGLQRGAKPSQSTLDMHEDILSTSQEC